MLVSGCLLSATWCTSVQATPADGYNKYWPYRQAITISSDLTPGDLEGFPVLISVTNDANTVFDHARADGGDVFFTASDGTTRLFHDLDTYDAGSGSEGLQAWLRIPQLSASVDTTVYMYYGNSTSLNIATSGTVEVWIRPAQPGTLSDDFDRFVSRGDSVGAYADLFSLWTQSTGVKCRLKNAADPDDFEEFGFSWGSVWLAGWRQVALRFHASTAVLYGDGRARISTATTFDTLNQDRGWGIGAAGNGPFSGSRAFQGDIDEVRISTVPRSAEWIAATYNTMSASDDMTAFGADEAYVPTGSIMMVK